MKIDSVYYVKSSISGGIDSLYLAQELSKNDFLCIVFDFVSKSIKQGNVSKSFLEKTPQIFKLNKMGENTIKYLLVRIFD